MHSYNNRYCKRTVIAQFRLGKCAALSVSELFANGVRSVFVSYDPTYITCMHNDRYGNASETLRTAKHVITI